MRLEIVVPGRPLPQPKPRRCPRPYLEADVAFLRSNFKTEWHEVKGWMDAKSRTRLANMARLYPSEVIVLIGKPWFYKAEYSALAPSIAGWEWTRRGART